ncbi:NAD(P)/FAD-dependent oxidoreductase, partial [Pelomonas sp. KK5]|uniref:NAD(P)/FAD-dependent oxidoreductase n=1 Tax=Pelomonas sp. KK5 TaxID=1855730 RepID=UPI0018E97DAF
MSQGQQHALVIGASLAGLLAARVLSQHYARVTLLERDALDELPPEAPRKGVPQGRHAHGLLAQGRVVLERYFPGLTEAVVARGGLVGDVMNEVNWYGHGTQLAQRPSPLVGLLTNRPLLEACVRERLLARPGIELMQGSAAERLLFEDGRVTGLACRDPQGIEQVLKADLVVDCSGRGSHGPQWLQALGWPRVQEERVEVGIGYTTRLYRRRPGDLAGKLAVVVAGDAPNWRNGAMLYHGPERWIVSVGGY